MNILDVLLSVVSGGATGLLGAGINAFTELKKTKEDNRHREVMADKDLAIVNAEVAGKITVARTEAEGAAAVADATTQAASYAADKASYYTGELTRWQRWAMISVDWLRGIARPALTIYLCVLTTLIYHQANVLIAKEDLTTAQAFELEQRIIETVLYLTTTCLLWWFGSRPKQNGRG